MRVLITGVHGQDASILAERHLALNHEVWGTSRVTGPKLKCRLIPSNILELKGRSGEVLDEIAPDRVYHLAAQHSSSTMNNQTTEDDRLSMYLCHVQITRNILAWQVNHPKTRSLVALSSQMYTPISSETQIDESSECNPSNYYGLTKVEALNNIRRFRESLGVHCKSAILFNHTSTRSKPDFLFPTIARQIVKVLNKETTKIYLANPEARVDMTHAKEICEGLFKFMEYEKPIELIFSSGRLFTIHEVIRQTFLLLKFTGTYEIIALENSKAGGFFLKGNPSMAKQEIGWKPQLTPPQILLEQVLNRIDS